MESVIHNNIEGFLLLLLSMWPILLVVFIGVAISFYTMLLRKTALACLLFALAIGAAGWVSLLSRWPQGLSSRLILEAAAPSFRLAGECQSRPASALSLCPLPTPCCVDSDEPSSASSAPDRSGRELV